MISQACFTATAVPSYSWTVFKLNAVRTKLIDQVANKIWFSHQRVQITGLTTNLLSSWLSIGHEFKCHPFSGLVDSACCLHQPTPFLVTHEQVVRRLNLTFGSSHIAGSAYQKRPTKDSHIQMVANSQTESPIFSSSLIKWQERLTDLKFENRWRNYIPPVL